MKNHLLATALLSAGLAGWSAPVLAADTPGGAGQDSSGDGNPWAFDIVPYLWLVTSFDGTFDLPGVPTGIARPRSESADPFSSRLAGVAMLTAQIHYREVGLFLDGAWLALETEGNTSSSLYSGTEIRSDIAYGTMALSYRLPTVGRLQSELFGGARVWYVGNEIEFKPGTEPGFTTDDSRKWTDPILGASLRYDFSKHWYGVVLGDAGGFGVGSDLSWNVFGGVGCQFADWCSATLGYRYMHLDYQDDRFLMDANIQGFLVGIGFHF